MKKITVFMCSLMLVLSLAGAAGAVPTTWTDYINFDPDVPIPPSFGYYHNIADEGFESWAMNSNSGDDVIYSYDLEIALRDDNVGSTVKIPFIGTITVPDGPEAALIWTLGGVYQYNFELTSSTYNGDLPLSLLGVLDIWHDGTLNVWISPASCISGDFYLDWSKLTARGDNGTAPVPEPATLLLLGTGLLGVVGANRKRFGKKK